MNTKQNPLKRILNTRGMGGALTAFAGLIVIYIAFGIINPTVFSGQNIMNLLRSMSKYLLIGIGQSYILITGNIDLSIGSVAGMSAMISATLMTMGVHPIAAILATLACCLVIGVLNGLLVGKWKLPPFIATLGTMFVARGVAYIVNGNRNTDAIASGIGKEAADAFGNFFYYGSTFGIYNTFWIAMALFVVFFFLLSGVSVLATTTKAYLVSAFCSCVVSLILCGQAGMGNMEAGNMYEMYGMAAGVIGGVSPPGRHRHPAGHTGRRGRVADPGERPEHDRRPGGHPAAGHRHHRGGRRVPGRGRPQRHPEKARQGRLSQRKLDTVRC